MAIAQLHIRLDPPQHFRHCVMQISLHSRFLVLCILAVIPEAPRLSAVDFWDVEAPRTTFTNVPLRAVFNTIEEWSRATRLNEAGVRIVYLNAEAENVSENTLISIDFANLSLRQSIATVCDVAALGLLFEGDHAYVYWPSIDTTWLILVGSVLDSESREPISEITLTFSASSARSVVVITNNGRYIAIVPFLWMSAGNEAGLQIAGHPWGDLELEVKASEYETMRYEIDSKNICRGQPIALDIILSREVSEGRQSRPLKSQ